MSFLLNSFKRTVRCVVTSGGSIQLLLLLLSLLLRILLARHYSLSFFLKEKSQKMLYKLVVECYFICNPLFDCLYSTNFTKVLIKRFWKKIVMESQVNNLFGVCLVYSWYDEKSYRPLFYFDLGEFRFLKPYPNVLSNRKSVTSQGWEFTVEH